MKNGASQHRNDPPPPRDRRTISAVAGGRLPRWVRDEVLHTTSKTRSEAALTLLGSAVVDFASGRFRPAARDLRQAKELAPRAATIRELLGLATYELGQWEESLRELRTYRRLTGEADHVAVELDCLRALGRPQEVTKTWNAFRALPASREADREARVVYGSFLLDQGRSADAWDVVRPGRLIEHPSPGDLRLWFVACRAALAGGDRRAAETIFRAIRRADSTMPGLDELANALAKP